MPSVLVRSGEIIDGLGKRQYKGHVLIEGDRIKDIVKDTEEPPRADMVIDAGECAVAPGFIDMHSHMDWVLPLHDHPTLLKRLLEQGITTVITGNCGFSPAPVSAGTGKLMDNESLLPFDRPLDYTWRTLGEFLETVEERRPVLNMAQLVGHSTIRLGSTGVQGGSMTADEQRNSLAVLKRSLDEGACGLSFGLGYYPATLTPVEEIKAFSAVAAKVKKPITVHLKTYSKVSASFPRRSRTPHNILALKEMIDVAKSTGVSLQVSHFMLLLRMTWGLADECLGIIDNARKRNIDIMMDAFPYTDANASVSTLLPQWFIAKLPSAYRSFWARMRHRFEYGFSFKLAGHSYEDFLLMDASVPGMEDLSGLTIKEIARRWKTSPSGVVIKLSEQSKGHAAILMNKMYGEPDNQKHLDSILSHDFCLFETDALIHSGGYPSPASLGTFPRILGHYVRDKKLFTLTSAIKRMTSLSADRFGIRDRGRLEKGRFADIVIFNPRTIADTPPSGEKPSGAPAGIRHVFLNGVHVVKDGTYIDGVRAGKILRM